MELCIVHFSPPSSPDLWRVCRVGSAPSMILAVPIEGGRLNASRVTKADQEKGCCRRNLNACKVAITSRSVPWSLVQTQLVDLLAQAGAKSVSLAEAHHDH